LSTAKSCFCFHTYDASNNSDNKPFKKMIKSSNSVESLLLLPVFKASPNQSEYDIIIQADVIKLISVS